VEVRRWRHFPGVDLVLDVPLNGVEPFDYRLDGSEERRLDCFIGVQPIEQQVEVGFAQV
jgi:hypothetical protein